MSLSKQVKHEESITEFLIYDRLDPEPQVQPKV